MLANADQKLMIVLNAHYEEMEFVLPEPMKGGWSLLLDTEDDAHAGPLEGRTVRADARALLLMETRA